MVGNGRKPESIRGDGPGRPGGQDGVGRAPTPQKLRQNDGKSVAQSVCTLRFPCAEERHMKVRHVRLGIVLAGFTLVATPLFAQSPKEGGSPAGGGDRSTGGGGPANGGG